MPSRSARRAFLDLLLVFAFFLIAIGTAFSSSEGCRSEGGHRDGRNSECHQVFHQVNKTTSAGRCSNYFSLGASRCGDVPLLGNFTGPSPDAQPAINHADGASQRFLIKFCLCFIEKKQKRQDAASTFYSHTERFTTKRTKSTKGEDRNSKTFASSRLCVNFF